MPSAMVQEVLAMIETEAASRRSHMDYELAYQARVAMDRIRFAIRHLEQFCPQTDKTREVGLQLLDALQRLRTADRSIQDRAQVLVLPESRHGEGIDGSTIRPMYESAALTGSAGGGAED